MQEGRCVMDRSADDKPAAVPVAETTAKQAGSCRARWAWSEPAIWTERMLAALEKGVKGGRMPTLPNWDCSISRRPTSWRVSPAEVY